ncbi:MAG: glucose dehydrogenase [Planctomycetaceae bacterium]|nr:glucose dehydrogenase [Planctomycetaceae bacterium]
MTRGHQLTAVFLFTALSTAAVADALASARVPNRLTEGERRGGWKLLFNGKSTVGWRNYRKTTMGPGWQIQQGALVRASGGAGDIVTLDKYEFFELSLEYRISKGGNSGIMFHVTEDNRAPWHSGPEIQVQDNVDGHDPQKSGWLYQLYKPVKPPWARRFEKQVGFTSPEVDDATRPAGQWNHIYLRIHPTKCEVAVNGVSYYYFEKGNKDWNDRVKKSKFSRFPNFGKATRGHICLQDHGNLVAYRNIKIRPLGKNRKIADPIDGSLKLQVAEAFPDLKWEGWEGVDDNGKIIPIRPMMLENAGDGSGRLFAGTQSGTIHVLPARASATNTRLFLDIRKRVRQWKVENEEGMLGLCFHPRHKDNGKFYVYYTLADKAHTSILSEFRVTGDDPDRADPGSERVLMRIPQPFANHNGGSLAFGPDGYLYVALGDGGGRNDPKHLAQDLTSLMGGLLRIDVDHKDRGLEYAIPRDNPFLDRKGARPELYAYGLRNVWRMSFDRKTGLLWVADVGQDLWEEINLIRKGGNYGWSIREASYNFSNSPRPPGDSPIEPIWEYDHQIGKSITGGLVYRGKRLPGLYGHYVYADFVTGKIWALKYDKKTGRVEKNLRIPSDRLPVLAFGEDEAGEIYFATETVNGRGLHRFDPATK